MKKACANFSVCNITDLDMENKAYASIYKYSISILTFLKLTGDRKGGTHYFLNLITRAVPRICQYETLCLRLYIRYLVTFIP